MVFHSNKAAYHCEVKRRLRSDPSVRLPKGPIVVTWHAEDRSEEREISSQTIIKAIKHGRPITEPEPGKQHQWKVKFYYRDPESFEFEVVVALHENEQTIRVVTVIDINKGRRK